MAQYYVIKKGKAFEDGIFTNYPAALACFHPESHSVTSFCKKFNNIIDAQDYYGEKVDPKTAPDDKKLYDKMIKSKRAYAKRKSKASTYKPTYDIDLSPLDYEVLRNEMFQGNFNQGQLLLISLNEFEAVNEDFGVLFNYKLFIVNSPGDVMSSLSKYDVKHVPHLAPSNQLFYASKGWKVHIDQDAPLLDSIKSKDTPSDIPDWWILYSHFFLQEINSRPDMISGVNRLRTLLLEGHNVLLICYCSDYKICHRTLIGMSMLREGFMVHFDMKGFYEYMKDFICLDSDQDDEDYGEDKDVLPF